MSRFPVSAHTQAVITLNPLLWTLLLRWILWGVPGTFTSVKSPRTHFHLLHKNYFPVMIFSSFCCWFQIPVQLHSLCLLSVCVCVCVFELKKKFYRPIALSAKWWYLNYSGQFWGFLPAGSTHCTNGDEIRHIPVLNAKFHPINATIRV